MERIQGIWQGCDSRRAQGERKGFCVGWETAQDKAKGQDELVGRAGEEEGVGWQVMMLRDAFLGPEAAIPAEGAHCVFSLCGVQVWCPSP